MIQSITLLARCNNRSIEADYRQNQCGSLAWSVEEKSCSNIKLIKLTLRNDTAQMLTLNRAFFRIILEPGPYELYSQSCRWGRENRANWQSLQETGVILTHDKGRTTEGNAPFCALRKIGEKRSVNLHLLPCGNWRIRVLPLFFSNSEPRIAVDLGMSDEELAFELAPGESWSLPEVIVHQSCDFDDSMAELHDFLRKFLPGPAPKTMPVIFNTWFDRFSRLDVEHLRESLKTAQELGCETFVIDAGWFGRDSGWGEVGDWREKLDRAFCGRMSDFASEVRQAGLNFGIWMEPERYSAGAPVVKEHPEWFIDNGFMDYKRLDIVQTAAFDYLLNEIKRLISTYDLKYIKFDMNTTLGNDESGCELYKYQQRFLALIDQIHAQYPEVFLENCSSGAMRCELSVMQHFDGAFPSDNVNPFTMLPVVHGLWQRFLPGRIIRWSTFREIGQFVGQFSDTNTVITPGEATFEEYERVDLESLLIANFTGGLFGFTGDITSLSPENRELVKKYIALYKSRREFMQNAAGIWLADQERMQQFELEYNGNAIVFMAYMQQDAVSQRTLYPKRLETSASYNIDGKVRTGADIMQNGITFDLVSNMHRKWHCIMKIIDKTAQ